MYLLEDVFTSEHGEAVTVLQLLTKFKMTLSEIDTHLNEYGNRLNSIEFKNVTQQQEIDALKSQVQTLQTNVSNLQLTVGDYLLRFTDLDMQLAVINGKITTNTTDISTLNSSLSDIQTSITNINNQLNTINSQIDGINTRLDISLSSISDLNDSVDVINTTLTTLSASITTLTTSVNDLTTLVNSLQNNLVSINESITFINNQISGINTSIGILDGRIDVLENNVISSPCTLVQTWDEHFDVLQGTYQIATPTDIYTLPNQENDIEKYFFQHQIYADSWTTDIGSLLSHNVQIAYAPHVSSPHTSIYRRVAFLKQTTSNISLRIITRLYKCV